MFAAIALIPLAVSAQTVTDDPKNPDAAVSAPPYHSVFSDYKSYQDPDVQSWKKSNADVRQSDSMKSSGMGGMKGMSDKNMGDMKGMPDKSMGDMKGMPDKSMGDMKGMSDKSMRDMKGMSDKSMGDMKANSLAPAGKKTISPSDQMPPSMPSMPAHDGMPSR